MNDDILIDDIIEKLLPDKKFEITAVGEIKHGYFIVCDDYDFLAIFDKTLRIWIKRDYIKKFSELTKLKENAKVLWNDRIGSKVIYTLEINI